MITSRMRHRLVAIASGLGVALVTFTLMGLCVEAVLRLAVATPNETTAERHRFFAHHPRRGWDLVPNTEQRVKQTEFEIDVRINEQGMRDDRTYDLKPPADVQRVVVVGDSFAFGHGVEVEDGIVARLAAHRSATEVLNLAVTGYGADQQLLKLLDDGFAYRPARVLVALFEGDVFRNTRLEQVGYPKPRFVIDRAGALRLTNVPVPEGARVNGWGRRSALAHLTLRPLRMLGEHAGFGEAWPLTEAIFARFAEACNAMGADLTVAILPKDQAIAGDGARQKLHLRTLRLIRDMLIRAGVDHIDLTTALTAARRADPSTPLYFALDGHWTAEGHRVAAVAIDAHWHP